VGFAIAAGPKPRFWENMMFGPYSPMLSVGIIPDMYLNTLVIDVYVIDYQLYLNISFQSNEQK